MGVYGDIKTVYSDCVVDQPDEGSSAGTKFDAGIVDDNPKTPGIMKEVQFQDNLRDAPAIGESLK